MLRKIACVGLLAGSAGCASFTGAPPPALPLDYELELIEHEYLGEEDTDGNRTGGRLEALLRSALDGAPDTPIARRSRNELVLARMYTVDLRYREFEKDLSQEARKSNFALKLVSLGLTGAASLISVSTTQAILAGVDTGLKGAGEAFSKDVLVERTVQVLTNQMRAERSRLRAEILRNLRKPIGDYPLFLALGQVEDYYAAGTLYGAIAALSEAVGKEASAQSGDAARAAAAFSLDSRSANPTAISVAIENWEAASSEERRPMVQTCLDFEAKRLRIENPPVDGAEFYVDAGATPGLSEAVRDCLNRSFDAGL